MLPVRPVAIERRNGRPRTGLKCLVIQLYLLMALLLSSAAVQGQDIRLPEEPVSPTAMTQCRMLDDEFMVIVASIKKQLQTCHENRKSESWGPVKGSGTCAYWGAKSCYPLIDACDAVNQRRQAALDTCRSKVAAHLDRVRSSNPDKRRAREEAAFEAYGSVTRAHDALGQALEVVSEGPGSVASRKVQGYLGNGLLEFARTSKPPDMSDALDAAKYDWVLRFADSIGRSVHRSPVTKVIYGASLQELSRQHRDVLSSLYLATETIASFSLVAELPALRQALPDYLLPAYDSTAATSVVATEALISQAVREVTRQESAESTPRAVQSVTPAKEQSHRTVSPNCAYNRNMLQQYLAGCAATDGCSLRSSMEGIVAKSCNP